MEKRGRDTFGQPQLLGMGMEGAVFGLCDGRVARVWFRREAAELRLIQGFHQESQSRSFAVRRSSVAR